MNLKALKDERGEVMEQMSAINATASEAKRSLTKEEAEQWDKAEARLAELDKEIARAEKAEQVNARLASKSGAKFSNETPEEKELKNFSFVNFVNEARSQKGLTGLNAEMHQEALKEARAIGTDVKGYGVPTAILNQRNTVTGGTQPADGSQLLQTDHRGMIEYLRDAQILRQAGAQYLTGLSGNVEFDTEEDVAKSTWKSENAELDMQKHQFGSKTMSPKRLGSVMAPSVQLLNQSSYDVEGMFRNALFASIGSAVDIAGINGSGAANEPLGVLNAAGIGAVSIDANGGAPTYEKLVEAESLVDIANALNGRPGFLINPKVRAKLKVTKLDAGSGQFLMPNNNELIGYGAYSSNSVPSDLTKGTGTNLSAIVFGNFNDLVIGQWGGLDLIVDPYTLATQGKVKLVINSYWDVLVRRAKSFAAIKDAVTTL